MSAVHCYVLRGFYLAANLTVLISCLIHLTAEKALGIIKRNESKGNLPEKKELRHNVYGKMLQATGAI